MPPRRCTQCDRDDVPFTLPRIGTRAVARVGGWHGMQKIWPASVPCRRTSAPAARRCASWTQRVRLHKEYAGGAGPPSHSQRIGRPTAHMPPAVAGIVTAPTVATSWIDYAVTTARRDGRRSDSASRR